MAAKRVFCYEFLKVCDVAWIFNSKRNLLKNIVYDCKYHRKNVTFIPVIPVFNWKDGIPRDRIEVFRNHIRVYENCIKVFEIVFRNHISARLLKHES